MALNQPSASYLNRDHVRAKDQLLARSLDDIMSKVQAVANQTNAAVSGKAAPPSVPTALKITASSGFASATITHQNAPSGTNYLLEYSTTPNFAPGTVIQEDNGISQSWQKYLKGQRLYFRAASRFSTSGPSSFIYFGTPTSPTAVTF